MAVTRINNNQITDASTGNVYLGIDASTKLQNYSVTAGKLANSLVYGSDLTVSGNLTVNGTSTSIDTTITTIEDPVIALASTQTGTPAVDIGFIGERGTANNIAFVWNESNTEFVAAFTSTSETNTTISIIGYANIHTDNAKVGGNIEITGTTSLVGNIISDANVTGDITGANLLTPGLISATSTITSDANISGANLLTSGTVSAAGTATAGNVATGGTVSATGDITGGNVLTGGLISATSTITSGANISGANLLTGGTVSATGNISGNYFIGNGSQLTGVVAESANAETLTGTFLANNVVASSLTSVGNLTDLSVVGTAQVGNLQTAGLVSATGTITGGNVNTSGNLSATGEITGGNIFTGGLISATGSLTAGSLETSGTANVTNTITGGNVATAGTVSATGTVTGGNVATVGTVSATGDITGGNLQTAGNVSATGTVTGGNVATAGTVSATGTVTGGNVATGGTVSATGNILGANVETAEVYGASTLTLTAGAGNIVIGTTGNVVLANTFINGVAYPVQDQDAASKSYVDNMVSTGLAFHESVVAATTGTLASATGGTLTYNNGTAGVGATLTTTGAFTTIDTANVQTAGTRILVKNESNAAWNGVYEYTNSTTITRTTDADQYGPDSSEQLSLNDYFYVTGGNTNLGSAWVVDAPTGTITFGTSNITFAQFSQTQVYSANVSAGLLLVGQTFNAKIDDNTTAFDVGGNIIVKAGANLTTPNIGAATGTSLSVTGTVTGGNLVTGGTVSATGTATLGNVDTSGTVSATGTITGGNVSTAGTVSATGTITGGNVLTSGEVSASANVTGANLVTGGLVTSTGNITGGNILTAGLVSSTGTVTGGNLVTGGTISATGTATVGNLVTGGTASITGTATVGNIDTSGYVSATGDVTGGNVNTAGNVSATGNVVAAYLIGNIVGTITSPGANTEVIFNDSGVANATAGFTFDKTANALTITGTVTGGNVATAGTVSATGTVTGGNVATGGTVSATGDITGGNVATAGTVSATGDITGGNLATGGTASATGNITGGNISTAGALQGGNIVISGDDITDTNGRVNFNTAGADVDFAVNGDTVANVFYVDAATGTASFGNSTQTISSVVAFNASNSILMPVGNTTQRPETGVTGQFRFNTTINSLEIFDNNAWVSVGQPDFTLITDEQFNGDGTTTVFTLTNNATTAGAIVSINGVQQIPVIAYGITGSTLTFTEAPDVGDLIDVRVLTTTTTVYGISNSSGSAQVNVVDGSPVVAVTGDLSVTGNVVSNGSLTVGNIVNSNANGVGNIGSSTTYFNTVFAKATSAQYADLAEKYVADEEYAPGTVVVFGGTHEVTVNAADSDRKVAGVVSTNPSYIMNGGLEADHVATVALTGRVPCMVLGPVRKGDMMVAAGLGRARAEADPKVGTVIGKALEDFDGAEGTIEVVVGRF